MTDGQKVADLSHVLNRESEGRKLTYTFSPLIKPVASVRCGDHSLQYVKREYNLITVGGEALIFDNIQVTSYGNRKYSQARYLE